MGLFRKITSVSTLGMVDFRSDKERIARYTKQTRNELRRQSSRAAAQDAAPRQQPPALVPPSAVPPALPEAQWAPDPFGRFELRWWDGHRWTAMASTGGVSYTDRVPGAGM